MAYEHYRLSSVGLALSDALDELVAYGIISDEFIDRIMRQFDSSINSALANSVSSQMEFTGKLTSYRFSDDVWTLMFRDMQFRNGDDVVRVKNVKVVACGAVKAVLFPRVQ
ncbi:unnamed protein product [Notodromas monacha]|uniref:Transcription initiation factor IIA subunit 2 n=1 Tax=Notodromas monacha TaxID=399045 RepID=A0A7R9BGU6_9CRUS|nr:unnamed protein product [Notodromas monacha]CAD7274913.1 unnamed protein product [Notodromas monacha]CAG0915064.1 unnamed protein product [Notodromas monacha]CAG0915065.1 unnamed protein product [Notodromas monacha]